jgi:hypothetical protein
MLTLQPMTSAGHNFRQVAFDKWRMVVPMTTAMSM